MKLILKLHFILFFSFLKAQTKPSIEEIKWAMCHPFVASKAKKTTNKTLKIVDSCAKHNCLDSYAYGGQLDAFRHGLWMAMLAQKISKKKIIALGKAHEKNNKKQFNKGKFLTTAVPDSVSITMDLFNNAIGADIGKNNKKLNSVQLAEIIINEVKAGNFYCIKRNEKGFFIDNLGNEISIYEQKKYWNNKKYLVKSNE